MAGSELPPDTLFHGAEHLQQLGRRDVVHIVPAQQREALRLTGDKRIVVGLHSEGHQVAKLLSHRLALLGVQSLGVGQRDGR